MSLTAIINTVLWSILLILLCLWQIRKKLFLEQLPDENLQRSKGVYLQLQFQTTKRSRVIQLQVLLKMTNRLQLAGNAHIMWKNFNNLKDMQAKNWGKPEFLYLVTVITSISIKILKILNGFSTSSPFSNCLKIDLKLRLLNFTTILKNTNKYNCTNERTYCTLSQTTPLITHNLCETEVLFLLI